MNYRLFSTQYKQMKRGLAVVLVEICARQSGGLDQGPHKFLQDNWERLHGTIVIGQSLEEQAVLMQEKRGEGKYFVQI